MGRQKTKLSLMFLTFAVLFFAQPSNVSATSGACSYHTGVNCAAGSSYTGNVICNDGWVNSSVKFYDTDECKLLDPCPGIISGLSCTNESDYARVQEQVDAMRGRQRAILANTGMIGSGSDNSKTIGQDQLDLCRKAIGLYSAMVSSREQCLNGQQQERIQQSEKDRQSQCSVLHGYDSFYNENKSRCECRDGYAPDSSATFQCVSMDKFCQDALGLNSFKSTGVYQDVATLFSMCGCVNGYAIGSSGICEKQVKPTKSISINAKSWADNASGPCANSAMSVDEKRECVDYQLHEDGYEWITYDSQKVERSASQEEMTVARKIGAVRIKPAGSDTGKTLSLAQVKSIGTSTKVQEKVSKDKRVIITNSKSTNASVIATTTSSQEVLLSTTVATQSEKKKTMMDKIRTFLVEWRR